MFLRMQRWKNSFQFRLLTIFIPVEKLHVPPYKDHRFHIPNLRCCPVCIKIRGQRTMFAPIQIYQNTHSSFNQVDNVNESSTIKTHDCLEGSELPELFARHCQPSFTCPTGAVLVLWAWEPQALWKWPFPCPTMQGCKAINNILSLFKISVFCASWIFCINCDF